MRTRSSLQWLAKVAPGFMWPAARKRFTWAGGLLICVWLVLSQQSVDGQEKNLPNKAAQPATSSEAKAPDRPQSDRVPGAAAYGATSQERLLMEQIDQLAAAGQFDEARASLERLVDNSQGRLIEVTPMARAATLNLQLHVPIVQWAHTRLHAWRRAAPEKMRDAARGEENTAVKVFESAQARHDLAELSKAVERYAIAPSNARARLFLSDLALDQGMTAVARQALETPGLSLRLPMDDAAQRSGAAGSSLPWPAIWPRLKSSPALPDLLDRSLAGVDQDWAEGAHELVSQLLTRWVVISSLESTPEEFQDTRQWAGAAAARLPEPFKNQVLSAIDRASRYFDESQAEQARHPRLRSTTFASDTARSGANGPQPEVNSWPKWTRQLERITGSSDRNPASKPPVAENMLSLLPYHPVVYDGRIYVNELTRIMAYQLEDGKIWPPTNPALPLFDSGLTAANYLPFGYFIMGAPRGTLTIQDDILYARMGPPVTGWFGRIPGDPSSSLSYLVALDLKRQGSMRAGFPVRLDTTQFPSAEFEGSPIILGDQVIACVAARDNVNLRRSVVSIHKESGALLWRSPVLASGTVSGSEQASLIAHQLVTAAGGRLYINTNLGAIACLDASSGQIVWLARYKRSQPAAEAPYARQDRYRYRDLNPCMIVGTQVICAPQDCPELFSLDSTSGELLWSTDSERVDDATQLLGASQESIIIGGDRIYWLERSSGRVVASFPAGTTNDVASALPAPRGYGRGAVGGDKVYWPTQNEIFIFDAHQPVVPNIPRPRNGQGAELTGGTQAAASVASPVIRGRIRLDSRGAEGGNLVLMENGVVIAGANRLFVFKR